jgi:PAS domain S-box-containing protein
LTRFWHRRICEAVFLVAGVILLLYGWIHLSAPTATSIVPLVSTPVAILAGVTLALSVVTYIWTAAQATFWSTYSIFIFLALAVGWLIVGSGGAVSPFIALWILLCVFAGIFGAYGLVPLFVAVTVFLVESVIGQGTGKGSIITIALAGEIPLVASYIIWHSRGNTGDSKDKAYRALASELSQVAGQSEVVINAITDGVVALDGQGTIQLLNPAAQQIIGWGKQDAINLNYKSVLKIADQKGSDIDDAHDPVAEVLATNKEVSTDKLMLITNSGKKLMVSLVISPVGQIGTGVIVVFRDITREQEENRQQAEFISTASHEMRTPVASIEGYLGLALNPATAQIDDKARDFITKAHESAQHLGRLFQDLLDVSKADDGRMSNNPKVVDMVQFVADIVQGLTPKAEAKGLRMHYKPLPDGTIERPLGRQLNPVFYTNLDNDHLREVVSNLVENAIKYTLKGDVTVDVTGDNEHVVVSIADSGIGIPKEDQAHLFQKFYRVDNSDTREIGGTGLGLYLCRRLTEAMNGRIWVESEYRRGSTFFVEFPRLDHEEATRLIETASIEAERGSSAPAIVLQPTIPALQPTTPVQEPTPPAAPVVAEPQAYAAPPQWQQPAPTPQSVRPLHQSTPPVNTPLTAIEQNPGLYMTQRPGSVNVPPRNQQ